MYGGTLKPGDPRRFLIEAIMGAVNADGVVKPEELAVLEISLEEHEIFCGLSKSVTKTLIEIAQESMAFAGGPMRRVPYMAKGLPSRCHRMLAYAVACEIILADDPVPALAEKAYLDLLQESFLLADNEVEALMDSAVRKKTMHMVEDLTEAMQKLLPLYIEAMALVAQMDGTVTAKEREVFVGVLQSLGDCSAMSETELGELINAAFKTVTGKEPDNEVRRIAKLMKTPIDRYWVAVYMSILAIADGIGDWRENWLLKFAQEPLKLSVEEMDRAFSNAKLFPIKNRPAAEAS